MRARIQGLPIPATANRLGIEIPTGGTWTLTFDEGDIDEVPLAAIEGGPMPRQARSTDIMRIRLVVPFCAVALFTCGALAGAQVTSAPTDGASPAATVLGEDVHTTDPETLQQAILTPLLGRYAAEHGIEAEPAEIDAFVEHLRQGLAADGLTAEEGLTPEETAEIDGLRNDMARAIIRQWKINKALYAQYGGRISYQQLGPEPLDAYRKFLEQRQAEGAFGIQDPALADGFWRYFTDESIHDFMAPGGADAARAFKVPPWEDSP